MKYYSSLIIPFLLLACSETTTDIPLQEKDFCSSIHRDETKKTAILSTVHALTDFINTLAILTTSGLK